MSRSGWTERLALVAVQQIVALGMTLGVALVVALGKTLVTQILAMVVDGGAQWPKPNLFLLPILFAVTPLLLISSAGPCRCRTDRIALVLSGCAIAAVLGFLAGEANVWATEPLATPAMSALLAVAGYFVVAAAAGLLRRCPTVPNTRTRSSALPEEPSADSAGIGHA